MSSPRTLVWNISSNWAGYAVQIAVAFFLTPFVVHSLGETRYGIWTLVVGVTGYYGLLDLGLSSGMTQYLTRYLAANDIDKLNRSASTGFLALSGVGTFVFIGSLIIAFSASSLFQIQAASSSEVTWILAVTGTSVALQFVFFTYSAVFTALQRFDLSNVIGISTRILSAVATIICLNAGYGLVGLSLVVAGVSLIDYLIRWRVAVRLLPAMKISPKLVNRESLREVVSFSIWNFVSACSTRLISYTDALVIATFMPVAAVAPFAIAANLRTYFDEIFVRVGFVFYPVVTELDAQGDQAGLKKIYLVSTKFMFLGSILFGSIAMFSAQDFFRLWVGRSYAEPAGYPSVASLFYLLVLGSMVAVAQRIGYQVLLGTRRVKLLALLFAVEGVCNLVISLALVRSYGLIGVALGTLIPAILFQGVLQPAFVCQSLQISLLTYCRQVLLRPALVLGTLVPLFLLAGPVIPSGDWARLVFATFITFMVATPLVLLLGLEGSERYALFFQPVKRRLKRTWIGKDWFDSATGYGQKQSEPLFPEVGIIALVGHEWHSPWVAPHHVLTRMARYFRVVWVNPAHEWRDALKPDVLNRPRLEQDQYPGFIVYNSEIWLPRLYRPNSLARLAFETRLARARQLLVDRGCRKVVLSLWRPEFQLALESMPFDLSCYHMDDEFSFSPLEVDVPLQETEANLIASVDQVFVVSPGLSQKKGKINPNTAFAPMGVDYQSYSTAVEAPSDISQIPRPRIGYTGVIKRQLDWSLLLYLSEKHPNWSFVFIGPRAPHPEIETSIQTLLTRHNVYFLGPKSVDDLARYPQHFDACIMPYLDNDYAQYIYPLKLHEYLASGQPTIATRIRSLEEFADVVTLVRTHREWSSAIEQALSHLATEIESRMARQRVAERYDWKYLICDIVETIRHRIEQKDDDPALPILQHHAKQFEMSE
jgi:O-antigen/teichoic acid export membrane protein/glycosyltransferase involved in cell wall biosynthesis